MDVAERDRSCPAFSTCSDSVSSLYGTSYLKSFLPVYQIVNQSANVSSICDRYKAIRFAADAALALTASGTTWSEALIKTLEDACGERGTLGNLLEATSCSSPDTSTISGATTMEQESPETARPGSMDERSILGRRHGLGADSALLRRSLGPRKNFALRSLMMGSRSNWCRNQRYSREVSRMALLRKVSLKFKSKRRSLRSWWKPRRTLKKAKSLARHRSRANCARPLTNLDPRGEERRLDSSLVVLQQLIPGGDSMDASVLLDETADFVMFLKMQVQALQSVCNAIDIRDELDD